MPLPATAWTLCCRDIFGITIIKTTIVFLVIATYYLTGLV